MMYLCYIEYEDGSISKDSIMLFETELESAFWKRIITKSYRDDKAIVVPVETETTLEFKRKKIG